MFSYGIRREIHRAEEDATEATLYLWKGLVLCEDHEDRAALSVHDMPTDKLTGLSDFDAFWAAYPRKVGKLDALKAYAKARILATPEEILAGVQRFREHLPESMQYVPHAATWLNHGRWMDEYDELPKKPQGLHVPSVDTTQDYLRRLRSVK